METITHCVATEQCKTNDQQVLPSNTTQNFTAFRELADSKSYVPIANCVFEHIITNSNLSDLEKLYYLTVDSLALINKNSGKQRAIALPSEKWATRLNCSRSQIFALQKSLTKKGYFIIDKEKNKSGQNKRNLIIPTLPTDVFDHLSKFPDKTESNKGEQHLSYNNLNECRRSYLDRTKLFFKLNYQLLQTITTNDYLNPFQKIVWLDFYTKCYKSKSFLSKRNFGAHENNDDFFCNVSYHELSNRYSCNKKHLAKSINILQEVGFIKAEHFYVKKGQGDQDRQDKSLWKITLTLPNNCGFELEQIKNRSSFKFTDKLDKQRLESEVALPDKIVNLECVDQVSEQTGSFSDPEGAKFVPLLNKNLKTNIFKDRSAKNNFLKKTVEVPESESGSNFCKNSFVLEEKSNNHEVSATNSIKAKFSKVKELKDFYPLSEEDCRYLQSTSGREFSLNAMNEILLDMSKRVTNRSFYSKKGFLTYMSKAFTYEKRDAVKISNIGFKIRSNQSKEEIEARQQEKYLSEIENSLQVSPEWHLKKKLACVLEPKKSYQLLKACRLMSREGGIFYIHLDKQVELTNLDREVILKQVKATHEAIDFESEELGFIEELKIVMPTRQNIAANKNKNSTHHSTIIPTGIWGDIRRQLIDIYGGSIDKHWFSKLEAKVDEEEKEIRLEVASNFIKDWIRQNYLESIEKLITSNQYKMSFC